MSRKVLIVDDDPITINLLRLILEPAGFVTVTAENGVEALAQVSAQSPDAVLLDVMMPIMDGFSVCHQLRANVATQSLPILILSTSAQAHSVRQGLEAGATKYLFKPISRDLLIKEVQQAIDNQ